LSALQTLRVCLSGPPNRRKQPERYAPLAIILKGETPMSSINFIKGQLHGKLGEIVGSTWKGKYYTKTYTKPENPNTPKQIETRYLFQQIAHIGKSLYHDLEQYTRPKPQKMSAYNHLVHLNKAMFNKVGQKWDPLELVIMSGELTAASITVATFDSTTFAATVTWDTTKGEPTDKAFVVIHDDESKRTGHAVEIDRSVGTVTIDASSFADVSKYEDIFAYLSFYHINEDGSGENSETMAIKVTKT
jgi:hypothetical protein